MIIDTFIFNLINFIYANPIKKTKTYIIEDDGYQFQSFPKLESYEIFDEFKDQKILDERCCLMLEYLHDALKKEKYEYAAALRRELVRTFSANEAVIFERGLSLLKKFDKSCSTTNFESFKYLKPKSELLLFNWELQFPTVDSIGVILSDIKEEMKLVPVSVIHEELSRGIRHNRGGHPVMQIDFLRFYFSLFEEQN